MQPLMTSKEIEKTIDDIDRQHERLVAHIDVLASMSDIPIDSEEFADWMLDFSLLSTQHFLAEDRFMRRIALPEPQLRAHIAAHQALLKDLVHTDQKEVLLPWKTVGQYYAEVSRAFISHMRDFDQDLSSSGLQMPELPESC